MDVAGLVFTAAGTLAGIAGAYFAWVAVRRPRRRRALSSVLPAVTAPAVSATGGTSSSVYDVFVSYSQDDIGWVRSFAERLELEGLKVALDELLLKPGDVLVHALEQAIRDSACGLLVFSPASVASRWVMQEYAALMQRSIEQGLRFIPVLIDDVQLPEFAATRLYADFRNVSGREYDRLIAQLTTTLRSP